MFEIIYKELNNFPFEISWFDLKKAILTFPNGIDQWIHYDEGDVSIQELIEFFEDELLDYFREDAKEQYRDYLELKNNPEGYYGVNRRFD